MLLSMTALRYLALGDSYTIGESVAQQDRWPLLLCEGLRVGFGLDFAPPVIVARTGWTTDELAEGILEAGPEGPFELVTLLIGVNNQYRGRPLEEYRVQFRGLLNTAITLAGGKVGSVIVVSIPDWGVTPFASGRDTVAISEAIDQFNAVNREVATARRVRYVDVTECSRLARTEPTMTADDGLHPSGAMYRLWTESILPEARGAAMN